MGLGGSHTQESHIWVGLPQDSAYKYYFSVMVTFAHSATRANGSGRVFLSLGSLRDIFSRPLRKTFNSTY